MNIFLSVEERLAKSGKKNIDFEIDLLMGGDKKAIIGGYERNLRTIVLHLLKWVAQPERRGMSSDGMFRSSWRDSINRARGDVDYALKLSGKVRNEIDDKYKRIYISALNGAIKQTGLSKNNFPKNNPWTLKEVLDYDFWPDSF